jgi:hypothetical protein
MSEEAVCTIAIKDLEELKKAINTARSALREGDLKKARLAFVNAIKISARIFRECGKEQDARKFEDLAERLRRKYG